MLAERAGVTLEDSAQGPNRPEGRRGPSCWPSPRGPSAPSPRPWPARPRPAPTSRGAGSPPRASCGSAWASPPSPATGCWRVPGRTGHSVEVLERVGLVVAPGRSPRPGPRAVPRPADVPDPRPAGARPRLRRPRSCRRSSAKLADAGKGIAKYLNSPETALFQKRRILYAADLARAAARESGWVAVVEGYTDVIAAHQVGPAQRRRHPRHGPGRRPRAGPQAAGRPRGPGLRRRRGRADRPPIGPWSSSWATRSTSGC